MSESHTHTLSTGCLLGCLMCVTLFLDHFECQKGKTQHSIESFETQTDFVRFGSFFTSSLPLGLNLDAVPEEPSETRQLLLRVARDTTDL